MCMKIQLWLMLKITGCNLRVRQKRRKKMPVNSTRPSLIGSSWNISKSSIRTSAISWRLTLVLKQLSFQAKQRDNLCQMKRYGRWRKELNKMIRLLKKVLKSKTYSYLRTAMMLWWSPCTRSLFRFIGNQRRTRKVESTCSQQKEQTEKSFKHKWKTLINYFHTWR